MQRDLPSTFEHEGQMYISLCNQSMKIDLPVLFGNIIFVQKASKCFQEFDAYLAQRENFKGYFHCFGVFKITNLHLVRTTRGKSARFTDRENINKHFFVYRIILLARSWIFLRLLKQNNSRRTILRLNTTHSQVTKRYLRLHRPLETPTKSAKDPAISVFVFARFRLHSWWVKCQWRPPINKTILRYYFNKNTRSPDSGRNGSNLSKI